MLIGVLPEQRGHRYVDQLLHAAYRAARARGFAAVQSLVDGLLTAASTPGCGLDWDQDAVTAHLATT